MPPVEPVPFVPMPLEFVPFIEPMPVDVPPFDVPPFDVPLFDVPVVPLVPVMPPVDEALLPDVLVPMLPMPPAVPVLLPVVLTVGLPRLPLLLPVVVPVPDELLLEALVPVEPVPVAPVEPAEPVELAPLPFDRESVPNEPAVEPLLLARVVLERRELRRRDDVPVPLCVLPERTVESRELLLPLLVVCAERTPLNATSKAPQVMTFVYMTTSSATT
jgi:signal-induced proliferation-associated 1 like protein 3